jgi:hypothetical protein
VTAPGRRHLLVLAPQCRAGPDLVGLDEAARALADVLSDAALGGCSPGLPDGRALLTGDVTAVAVEAAIRAAIGYAAEQRATLLLSLVGHGFTAGPGSLYLMAADSAEDVRDTAVDVPRLLVEAADRQGIRGVVAIVDTCHAGGAVPPAAQLSTGVRAGQTQLALIMAASASQEAYELRLTRKLVEILRTGLPGRAALLTAGLVADALRTAIPGQDVAAFAYDADPTAPALWLAYNRAGADDAAVVSVGPLGTAELQTALRILQPDRLSPPRWHESSLTALRDELDGLPDSPARTRVAQIVDSLAVALRTRQFLRMHLGSMLTTARLRQAVAELRTAPGVRLTATATADAPPRTDADFVEHVALGYAGVDDSCRGLVVRFVHILLAGAGLDLADPAVHAWAASIDATVAANDAAEAMRARHRERVLRLVVSLHASVSGDWPEVLDVWLMHDGRLHGRIQVPCQPDRAGVEAGLVDAIDWAEDEAQELGLQLRRVEIAVPTGLLPVWRPEEVEYGTRLGVNYDVVIHWSQRLNPPASLRWINSHAEKRLAEMTSHSDGAPVDWLGEDDTRELDALRASLRDGRYTRAIAIAHSLGDRGHLFDLLLAYAPILLWPDTGNRVSADRSCLDLYWDGLPAGLTAAYRRRWRGDPTEVVALLRAVWDDQEWLEFCRNFRRHTTRPGGTP